MKHPLGRALRSAALVAAVLPHALAAAANPCKVACKATKHACVAAAKGVFTADKAACALAPSGPERRSCKQTARAAFAAAKAVCRADKLACAAACAAAPGPTCGDAEAVAVSGVTSAHDAVRANPSLFSNGMTQPAPDPALVPLCYSSAIAAVAQAWADQCRYMHNAGRGSLGENIYAEAGPGTGSARTPADAVELWSAEAEFFDHASNTCDAPTPPGTCGHYTQVVWRDTDALGCGVRTCTTNSPFPGFATWTFVVCNYEPPGNVILCGPGGCVPQKPY